METRAAVIGIIVENNNSIEKLNYILHQYSQYIIGRMSMPYRRRKVNIISIVLDAPQDIISAVSGKIGKLPSISAKTAYSKTYTTHDK
jgi:putative iron-only hydrogenase system regulator